MTSSFRRIGSLWLGLALVAGAGVLAEEGARTPDPSRPAKDKKKPAAAKPAPEEPSAFLRATTGQAQPEAGRTYTNEDLDRLFGKSTPPEEPAEGGEPVPPPPAAVPGTGSAAPADPLAKLEEERLRDAERTKLIADAEKKVADSRQRIAELERGVLATKNPYLPRPQLPKTAAQDGSTEPKDEKLDNNERLRRFEEALEKARKDLEESQRELERLRGS